jgi:EAL domain-containing protein (putative c-di-GMP-specific phosphodiesterase class I)
LLIPQVDVRRAAGSALLVSVAGLLTILVTWFATRWSLAPAGDRSIRTRNDGILGELRSRARTLTRPPARESPEEIAAAICDELLGLADVQVAEVITIGDGESTRIGFAASGASADIVPPPIPPARAAYLRARAAEGPWLDEAAARRDDATFGAEFSASGVRTVAYWPLQAVGEPLGVVAVGTRAPIEPDMFRGRLLGVSEIGTVASALLVPTLDERRRIASIRSDIQAIVQGRTLSPVFQPIVELESRGVAGFEAFTRFDDGASPEQRFGEASRVGLGLLLEEACLDAAIHAASDLPASAWVSFNVSPELLESFAPLEHILEEVQRPVVVEMSDPGTLDLSTEIRSGVDRLKGRVELAVDQAGAEFPSLRHILELRPRYVKLDRHLVQGIESDLARQAQIVGMRHFATEIGSTLIAEGIETEGELATLRSLGVPLGQGYLLGRPAPAPDS